MPQLNPEFYVSQLFWLILTFVFLFFFLWKISLPRISSVLKKRETKISDDIKMAKQLQTESEEIQKDIDKKLLQTKLETTDLIKSANSNFQDHAANEILKIEKKLNNELEEVAKEIERSKANSLKEINNQIYDISKLIISKITNISISENEVKVTVDNLNKKALH